MFCNYLIHRLHGHHRVWTAQYCILKNLLKSLVQSNMPTGDETTMAMCYTAFTSL